jgi:hypothetical protein
MTDAHDWLDDDEISDIRAEIKGALQGNRILEGELQAAHKRIAVLEAAWQHFIDTRWAYWPPRKGELHCRYCGKRSWHDDNPEQHTADCPITVARALLAADA